jgi:uncharacterized protein RhaS with RHS repeats
MPSASDRKLATVDGPLSNDVISYAYDELGRVRSRAINGVASRATYDSIGRITVVTNVLGVFTNSYVDATPRLNSVTYPNGQTIELAYFGITNDQRLQTIWNKDSAGATLSRFDYTFDENGSIDTWKQQLGTISTNTWNLAYDRISQLLEASVRDSTTSALLKQFIYGYDPAGNRTREQIDMSVTTANHNALNQLTNTAGAGPVRFSGQLSEPGMVSVGGSARNFFGGQISRMNNRA